MPGNLHLFEYVVIMKRLAPLWHLIKISKCLQSPLSGFKTVELFSLSVDQKLWQVMCHTKFRKSFQYALSEKTTYMMAIAQSWKARLWVPKDSKTWLSLPVSSSHVQWRSERWRDLGLFRPSFHTIKAEQHHFIDNLIITQRRITEHKYQE